MATDRPSLDSLSDKLPPQDIDAEQVSLGACLIEEGALVRVLAIVEQGDFYREGHRVIFAAIKGIRDRGEPVDLKTAIAELRREGQLEVVGGPEYLAKLIAEVPTTAHVVRYADIVREKSVLRALITAGAQQQAIGYGNPADVDEALLEAAGILRAVTEKATGRAGAKAIAQTGPTVISELEQALESRPHTGAAVTGIAELDAKMGGLGDQRLVVPTAREKIGKSMFVRQCALASGRAFREEGQGRVVVCYVLEALTEWHRRAVAWLGNFNSNVFTPPISASEEDHRRFAEASREYQELPLYVTGELWTVEAIAADLDALALDTSRPVALVIIDHLQRLGGAEDGGDSIAAKNEARAQLLAEVAERFACPFVCPSQQTEDRTKWSRAWEENATWAFGIVRGDPSASRETQQGATWGKLTHRLGRLQPPFVEWPIEFDLGSGHITSRDGGSYEYDRRND